MPFLALLFLAFSLSFAFADEQPPQTPPPVSRWKPPPTDKSLSLGIGTLIGHNHRVKSETWPYNARTYTRVVPVGEFRYGRFRMFGPFGSYTLLQTPDWGASLRLGIQGDQYRGPFMEERDWSFFGGGSLRYKWVEFSYAGDLQSVSKGSIYSVETGPRLPLSRKIFLITSLGASYLDRNYANHYYGVRKDEALPGWPAYEPGKAFIYHISLRPIIQLTDSWTLLTLIRYNHYSPEITGSPTVRKEGGLSGLVGLTYKIF